MVDKIWYNMEELIGGSEERGINRNILECKGYNRATFLLIGAVLIETYWNVKTMLLVRLMSSDRCINRNILECKEIIQQRFLQNGLSINRNILECKDQIKSNDSVDDELY